MAVWSLQASAAGHIVGISLLTLGIAHQEQVDVVGLKRRVERRPEMLSRTHRPDEMRGDDDDKIGLVLLEVGGAKKRAKDWQVANPGQLIDGLGRLRLSRPAMAKLCPSRSSTAVWALRSVKDGTVVPFMLRLLAVFTSVTDGFSCKLIMPLLSTVGVKSRPTPYCFHSIETFGV